MPKWRYLLHAYTSPGTTAVRVRVRVRLTLTLTLTRYDCGLFMTGTLTLTLTRYDCGLFMTGTRGELFATHVIALFIQVRSCSK